MIACHFDGQVLKHYYLNTLDKVANKTTLMHSTKKIEISVGTGIAAKKKEIFTSPPKMLLNNLKGSREKDYSQFKSSLRDFISLIRLERAFKQFIVDV